MGDLVSELIVVLEPVIIVVWWNMNVTCELV